MVTKYFFYLAVYWDVSPCHEIEDIVKNLYIFFFFFLK